MLSTLSNHMEAGKGPLLWHIHTLNNADKHRLLIPVWTNLVAHTILPSQRSNLERLFRGSHPGEQVPDLTGMYIGVPDGSRMLNDGDKLLTISHSEMEDKMDFRLQIAFGEPEVIKGRPVIETLKSMHDLVLQIIGDFSAGGLL